MSTTTLPAVPYTPEQIASLRADFERDGYLLIKNVFSPDEVAAMKAGIDRVFEDEAYANSTNRYDDIVAVRLFETAPLFEELLTREPLIGLAEAILGPDCHLMAQNAVRNAPGRAIDFWHADDLVMFPVAEGMEAHDPRLRLPIFLFTFQIPLTDIPALEYGPTQYVPGSQRSGREPNDPLSPTFEGQGPVSILCEAGDVYLHNGQCWHRGAPNTSDTTRYLFQMAFSMRFISQRLFPFVNYQIPPHVLANADERRKRVLGVHPKGAYG